MPRVRRQPCETKTRSNSLSCLRIGRSSQRGNQVRRGAEDRFQRPANEPRNGSSCPTVRENGHRRSLRGLRVSFDRQKDDGDQREKLSLSREIVSSTVADRHYVIEQGRVVDSIALSEMPRNVAKLGSYLGIAT